MGERETRAYPAFKAIMAAARQGQISPAGALRWAAHAAAGGSVDVLADLTGPPGEERLAWIKAAADPALAQKVLEVLLRLAEGLPSAQGEPGVDEEFRRLFPPRPGEHQEQPNRGLVYPGEGQGRRDRPVTSWDGYVSGSGAPFAVELPLRPRPAPVPFAVEFPAGPIGAAAPGEMTDAQAALLWPPRDEEEAERRADAAVLAKAARVEELPDEELHRLLFGDTTGEDAG